MCRHTGSTFHQVSGSACTREPCCRAMQGLPRSGRLMWLEYNPARSDIPSLRLGLLSSHNHLKTSILQGTRMQLCVDRLQAYDGFALTL